MICIRINHTGGKKFNEIHSCECCKLSTVEQVITALKAEFDGKQFLIPCSYIENDKVYRIGLENIKGEKKNYIWEVNEKNYNLFIVNIQKAYGINLPKAKGLTSKEMDENLFNFFKELYNKDV